MLDLCTLDLTAEADKGRVLHLAHPVTGLPLFDDHGNPVTLTMRGTDSTVFRARVRDRAERMMAETPDAPKRTWEQHEAESIEDLVALTVGWSEIGLDGQLLPFSQAAARTVYQRFSWIRQAAERFCGTRSDFFADLAASSSTGTASVSFVPGEVVISPGA